MQKDFELLIKTLERFESFSLIDASEDATWIHFKLNSEFALVSIVKQIDDIKEQYPCNLLVLSGTNNFSYQLVIETKDNINAIKLLNKKLMAVLDANGNAREANNKELGLPDLSLITLRQIATELKQRQNLTFALVWIENNERDNIAIEGSGNPTQLVGLLTRGTHMAIEWADKNIKFYRPEEDE